MQLQAFDETITKKRLHIFYEGRVVSLASTSELLSKKTKPKREMTYKWKKFSYFVKNINTKMNVGYQS